jgi:hypothetical protein
MSKFVKRSDVVGSELVSIFEDSIISSVAFSTPFG